MVYTRIRIAGSAPIFVRSVKVQHTRAYVLFHNGGGRWFASADIAVLRTH